jgi:NADPH:quinone reductase-like Zn-dependent oxidoreductase
VGAGVTGLEPGARVIGTNVAGQRAFAEYMVLPAAAAYTRDQDGNYQPYGICVLTVTDTGIRRISSFGDPRLVTVFGSGPDMA